MREILFRGKRESDGKWIYGYYADDKARDVSFPCIFPLSDNDDDGDWAVLPETVGQYTGLKDKNGNRIFEGDIVRRVVDGSENMVAEIINISGAVFEIDFVSDETSISDFTHYDETDFEIIGNIHDNPELLEEV